MTPRRLLVLALVVASTPALADPGAEAAFRRGRDLLKAGKLDEACNEFQSSQDLEPRVGTLLNLADCRERQGRIATAWELFVAAKALALKLKDDRAAEAGKRADAIVGKRAFLTVHVPPDHRVEGLAITRDGAPLPASAWEVELPIDPAVHTLAATAPGYERAEVRVEVIAKSKTSATIPKLVAVAVPIEPPRDPGPTNPTNPTTSIGVTPPAPGLGVTAPAADRRTARPKFRTFAVGVAGGGTSDRDLVPGLRASVGVPVTGGAVRAILTGLYARLPNNPDDPYDNSNLFAIGLALDYVWAWRPGLASAAGVGFGVDINRDYFSNPATSEVWFSPRLSPVIVRFERVPLEVGLHAHLALPGTVLIGVVGIDWFFK